MPKTRKVIDFNYTRFLCYKFTLFPQHNLVELVKKEYSAPKTSNVDQFLTEKSLQLEPDAKGIRLGIKRWTWNKGNPKWF